MILFPPSSRGFRRRVALVILLLFSSFQNSLEEDSTSSSQEDDSDYERRIVEEARALAAMNAGQTESASGERMKKMLERAALDSEENGGLRRLGDDYSDYSDELDQQLELLNPTPDDLINTVGSALKNGFGSLEDVDDYGFDDDLNDDDRRRISGPRGGDCFADFDCQGNFVCRNEGKCGPRGNNRGQLADKCAHDTDCFPGSFCILGECDTTGKEGTICFRHWHCRANQYCKQTATGQPGVCTRRMRLGTKCQQDFECTDSLCMPPQIRDEQTRLGLGRYCSKIGASQGHRCYPFKSHCHNGLECIKVQGAINNPQVPRRVFGGGFLRRGTNRRRFKRQIGKRRGGRKRGKGKGKNGRRRRPFSPLFFGRPNRRNGKKNRKGGKGGKISKNKFAIGTVKASVADLLQPTDYSTYGTVLPVDVEGLLGDGDLSGLDLLIDDNLGVGTNGISAGINGGSLQNNPTGLGVGNRGVVSGGGNGHLFQCFPVRHDSRAICTSNRECPCGEMCDRAKGSCGRATCQEFGTTCSAAYGFPISFQCKAGVCMPPESVLRQAYGRGKGGKVKLGVKRGKRGRRGAGIGKRPGKGSKESIEAKESFLYSDYDESELESDE